MLLTFMQCQATGNDIRSRTFVTFKWIWIRMSQNVFFHMELVVESFLTDVTFVRFANAVSFHVVAQRLDFDYFLTYFAFCSVMIFSYMRSQMSLDCKSFRTKLALKFFGVPMN